MAEISLSDIQQFLQQLNERLMQLDAYMSFILREQEMAQNMTNQALEYCRLWLAQENL